MTRARRQERGIVAVLVAIALLALLAMAGLAIDIGHLVLNKSRLQSAVDAAALAAAKELSSTGNRANAELVAQGIFDANAEELSGVLAAPTMRTPLEYSDTLMGFRTGETGEGRFYVRVVAGDFRMWTSFAAAVGLADLGTTASAVAGRSAPLDKEKGICDVLPLMVCIDREHGTKANGWNVLYPDRVTPLKVAVADSFAPGNSGLVCLEEGSNCGATKIRQWLREGGCIPPSGNLNTKPGTVTGPTEQGLSTRFTRSGLPDWPPDQVTDQVGPPTLTMQRDNVTDVFFCLSGTPDRCRTIGDQVTDIDQVSLNHDDYKQRYVSEPPVLDEPELGTPQRRVVALPVVDCGPEPHGRATVAVKDLACFYLLQDIIRVPGNPAFVLGQYVDEPCAATGIPGDTPGSGSGTEQYKIVLHNDPVSADS